MKKNIFIILIFAFALLLYVLSVKNKTTTPPSSPLSTSSPEVFTFCSPKNLSPSLESEGAAGSMYVTLTIQNSGNTACQIQANNSLEIDVQGNPKNVATSPQPSPASEVLLLEPQAKAYAQIRIPNGPQCTKTVTSNAHIQYYVSPHNGLVFTTNEKKDIQIQSCVNEKEVTMITVWPWALQPINQ